MGEEEQSATRNTLATQISLSGVGLHSGVSTTVRVLPAPREGRYFVRVDLPQKPVIPANVAAVTNTQLSTQLGIGEASVRTVEHLLAALAGMGVDDARIEIDGPEVPLLEGSAQRWVEEIAAARLVRSPWKSPQTPLLTPIWVHYQDAFVAALPAPITRFTYGIDFDDVPAIGNQWYSWAKSGLGEHSFAQAIAPARTFGLAHQIEALQQQGLIKGGSLDNALVCDRTTGWLNPPLRFANEPVRHKILDLVGDLSLVENLPIAHFLAYKASHNLHIQLAQLIQKLKTGQGEPENFITP
ncbi:UDP-3-O-acyl-N-acetylglucosamine deacetylase [Synechocystis sp. PCC 7509]|uniref:UDP-3-O-acyl-N-acetylglucosamine deacetylase n=1 Tax=Synechocystis sp. PCC 7509 TaxID=927677 RepID=UPI0002ABB8CA|nr:UDP-3-O-acyl-N-acetylglucosamine deacetylase [Synechocystis sp. PCC 7509]